MKEKANNFYQHGKRVFSNAEQFVQAIALLVVAVTTYLYQQQTALEQFERGVIVVSLAIIGLRGAYELLKFLDKENK